MSEIARGIILLEMTVQLKRSPVAGLDMCGVCFSSPVDGLPLLLSKTGYIKQIAESLSSEFDSHDIRGMAGEILSTMEMINADVARGRPVPWCVIKIAYIQKEGSDGWILSALADFPMPLSQSAKEFPYRLGEEFAEIFKDFYCNHLKNSDIMIQYIDSLIVASKDATRHERSKKNNIEA